MKVLAVGGGGREHAIVEALRSGGAHVYAVMKNKNPGIARASKEFLLADEVDVDKVVAWGVDRGADIAIIGPEAPLGHALVDRLEEREIPTVGPTQAAAQIELSKEFARDLMKSHDVPGLVEYQAIDDLEEARQFLRDVDYPVVIKPIGLTGGKGVKVMGDHFQTQEEALACVKEVFDKRIGGQARVLIERREEGEEFSLQAFTDGVHLSPMPAVQDYKRAYEGDEGPNTGGMGSISDVDGLLPFMEQGEYDAAVMIMRRTIEAMGSQGIPYKGVLYGGFILTAEGPKVLEFNARFGDPEAMNVLPILDEDLVEICWDIVDGGLREETPFKPLATVCKYVVPEGYGTQSLAGEPLEVDEGALRDGGAILYYASVDERDGSVLTTTSRSLAVVGVAEELSGAAEQAEEALKHVSGRVFMRHDIGEPWLVEKKVARMKAIRGG